MAEVERLLVASTVQVAVRDPRHPDARACLRAYFSELAAPLRRRLRPRPQHLRRRRRADPARGPPPGRHLARRAGRMRRAQVPRRRPGRDQADVGRARRPRARARPPAPRPSWRRTRRPQGVRTLRLETNRALDEAIGLYRAAGYREVPAFNDEPYAHHWFEKTLDPGPGRAAPPRGGERRPRVPPGLTARRVPPRRRPASPPAAPPGPAARPRPGTRAAGLARRRARSRSPRR